MPVTVNSLNIKSIFLMPILISGISSVFIDLEIHIVTGPDLTQLYCPITSSTGFPLRTAGFRLVISREGHHPPDEHTVSIYIVACESPSKIWSAAPFSIVIFKVIPPLF